MNPSLLIIADRGHLLAYSIDRTNRNPVPRQIQALDFLEGHQRLGEQLTDKAGSFPMSGGKGQAGATAERMTLVSELESRSFRQVAGEITSILKAHGNDAWGFAAPAEINGAILDGLDPGLRERLVKNLPSDLTHIPADRLLAHFSRD